MTKSHMNEDYLCKYCGKGKVRPIHFSLKQAIIDCDNIDCESFLEKGPLECVITKPLLESSSLCKYERDSVCSDSSSGVHSDFGSSNFSQSSLTDREVELLLKSYQSLNSQPSASEWYHQHPPPWHSKLKPTNQEPFVALDSTYLNSNEMSIPDQQPEATLISACNEANSIGNDDFFEMLKEISFEEISVPPNFPSKEQISYEDPFNQEIKPVFDRSQDPSPSVNLDGTPHGLIDPDNGFTFPDLSPSKAIIPSIGSAFSEVSPNKINLKSPENPKLKDINYSSQCNKSSFDLDEILSSTSSHLTMCGEGISFNESSSLPIRKIETSSVSPKMTLSNKSFSPYLLSFDQIPLKESPSTSLSPVEHKYMSNLNHHSPLPSDSVKLAEKNPPLLNNEVSENIAIPQKPYSSEKEPIKKNDAINNDLDKTINILELLADCPSNTSTNDHSSLTQKQEEARIPLKESPSTSLSPAEHKYMSNLNHHSPLPSDSVKLAEKNPPLLNSKVSENIAIPQKPYSSEKEPIKKNDAINDDLDKMINILELLADCPSNTSKNDHSSLNQKQEEANKSPNISPSCPLIKNSSLGSNNTESLENINGSDSKKLSQFMVINRDCTVDWLKNNSGPSSTKESQISMLGTETELDVSKSITKENSISPKSHSPEFQDLNMILRSQNEFESTNIKNSINLEENSSLFNNLSLHCDVKNSAEINGILGEWGGKDSTPSLFDKIDSSAEKCPPIDDSSHTLPPSNSPIDDCPLSLDNNSSHDLNLNSGHSIEIEDSYLCDKVSKTQDELPSKEAPHDSSSPNAIYPSSSNQFQLKIDSLSDSENQPTTKGISAPLKFSSYSDIPSHCRKKTVFNGGFEVDPWSVPEVYIDELNIEVVVGKPSAPQPTVIKKSIPTNCHISGAASLPLVTITQPVAVTHTTTKVITSTNQGDSTTNVTSASPFATNNATTSSSTHLPLEAPPKMDIYQPFTLRPEVVTTEYLCDQTVFAGGHPDRREPRRSVGYESRGGIPSPDNVIDPCCLESDSSKPTRYLRSLLSNLVFDENFCVTPYSGEGESSLENSVSKRLFAEDLSSCEIRPREFSETRDKKQLLGVSNDVNSDNDDIPIVTIDSNDELAIHIPAKKVKVSETPVEWSENQTSRVYDQQRKGKRKLVEEDPGGTKKFKSTLQNAHDQQLSCGIYDSSFPHSNPCFISTLTIDVPIVKTPRSTKTLPCYVSADYFTIFDFHERFGNLKMEPEFFRDFSSSQNLEEDISLLDADCLDCDRLGTFLWGQDLSAHGVEDVSDKKNRDFKVPTKRGRKPFSLKLNDICHAPQDGASCPSFSSFSKYKSTKNRLRSRSKRLLGQNPSVPEVLKLLNDSGWVVTPCNPVINYKVLPHPVSPTIVPPPLQSEYGDTGSDVVLWALTDTGVPFPNTLPHKTVDNIKMDAQPSNMPSQSPSSIEGRDLNQFSNSLGPVRRGRGSNGSIARGRRTVPFQLPYLCGKQSHIFPHSNTTVFKPYERALGQDLGSPSVSSLVPPTGYQGSRHDPCLSLPLKTLRTTDGATYVRPKLSRVKEEPPWIPPYLKDDSPSTPPPPSIDDEGGESDECIELPDDFDAYEAALRGGFQVQAPPILPKNVFIPPPAPSKPRLKRTKPSSTSTLPLSPSPSPKNRADDLLSTIISQRSLKEVPEFVCMSIEGKMYVYHRKN